MVAASCNFIHRRVKMSTWCKNIYTTLCKIMPGISSKTFDVRSVIWERDFLFFCSLHWKGVAYWGGKSWVAARGTLRSMEIVNEPVIFLCWAGSSIQSTTRTLQTSPHQCPKVERWCLDIGRSCRVLMKGQGTGRWSVASSTEFGRAVGGRAVAESGDLCFQPVAIY